MEQVEALVTATDKLLGCPESLFQSEIKEENTQKLDTVAFCYLTFTSGPLSLQLLGRQAPAKIKGGRSLLLCGGNAERSVKMLDRGEGVEKREQGGGKKRTSAVGYLHPHCLFNASTHDISPLERNGIDQGGFRDIAPKPPLGVGQAAPVTHPKGCSSAPEIRNE